MDLSPYSDRPLFSYRYFIYSPSWQCKARCRHCFIPADKRRSSRFERRVLERALDTAPKNLKIVGLTGGEPFDHMRRFMAVLRAIKTSGRVATVVTNGLWAREAGDIRGTLKRSLDLGLVGLAVSLDDYHRPRLEVEQIRHVLESAREIGLAVHIKAVGRRSLSLVSKLEATGVMYGQEKPHSSFDLERVGPAEGLKKDLTSKPELGHCKGAMEPMVTPDGKVLACCSPRLFSFNGPPLVLGNVLKESLDVILQRASRSYLLGAVAALGPGGLVKLLGRKIPRTRDTRCSLCTSILTKPELVEQVRNVIAADRQLRKNIAGRLMVYEELYRPEFLPEIQTLLDRQEKRHGA